MSTPSRVLPRPLNVALLLGGPSAEREVSLESGREVAAALRALGHRVTEIDPDAAALAPQAFRRLADWRRFDAAFLALHGTFGEDGTVQRLLDSIGLPYTGSGPEASRVAFHKSAAKERFAAEGVPTPEANVVHANVPPDRIAAAAKAIGYPLVVKPDAQGSSLGVSLVRRAEELGDALTRCFALGPFGLLEAYVPGEEWTVGFLGDGPLPPMRVSTARSFLDFDAKYRDEETAVVFGEGTEADAVVAAADGARRAVGATGVCRVDVRLDPQGRPWVLEVNTLPGFTPHSAVPTAAARVGLDFGDLCERVLSLAVRPGALRRAA